jgi:hypothetical protein
MLYSSVLTFLLYPVCLLVAKIITRGGGGGGAGGCGGYVDCGSGGDIGGGVGGGVGGVGVGRLIIISAVQRNTLH